MPPWPYEAMVTSLPSTMVVSPMHVLLPTVNPLVTSGVTA